MVRLPKREARPTPSLSRLRRQRQWKSRLRVFGGLLVAALVVGAVGWLLYFSPYLEASRVEVHGNQIASVHDIEVAARAPLGKPLARADLGAIRKRVLTVPAVESADVSRSWPHAISITVVERTPVAVVDKGQGLQLVDKAGVLFGTVPKRPAGLPLIQAAGTIDQAALSQAGQVAAALSQDFLKLTDVLTVKSADDIELQLKGGRTVLWGSASDSDTKAHIAELLLRQPVKVVDVSVPNRPTTS